MKRKDKAFNNSVHLKDRYVIGKKKRTDQSFMDLSNQMVFIKLGKFSKSPGRQPQSKQSMRVSVFQSLSIYFLVGPYGAGPFSLAPKARNNLSGLEELAGWAIWMARNDSQNGRTG